MIKAPRLKKDGMMKIYNSIKFAVCAVLFASLAGCFEPSGKNFEGAWVREGDHGSDPQTLDIKCSGGYCDFVSVKWDFLEGRNKKQYARPKVREESVLVWEGAPLAAYFKSGKIHFDGNVYIRRE
ncbi:hypothetical protein JTL78_33440 [Pseudomonas aeruginosa]|nr:hypothetical protein [Pseudomonas aeruginosa]